MKKHRKDGPVCLNMVWKRGNSGRQISDMILYYYQGLRMWSRVIPFTQETAAYYSRTIRQLLYNE